MFIQEHFYNCFYTYENIYVPSSINKFIVNDNIIFLPYFITKRTKHSNKT